MFYSVIFNRIELIAGKKSARNLENLGPPKSNDLGNLDFAIILAY